MITMISIAWGIFAFSLVLMLLGAYGAGQEHMRKRVAHLVNGDAPKANIIDEELGKPLYERLFKPAIKFLSAKIAKYLPQGSHSKNGLKKPRGENLKKMLHQAGLTLSVSEYILMRSFGIIAIAFLFGLISVFLGLGVKSLLAMVLGACFGYAILRFDLSSKISKRQRAMEKQIPDALDLLSVNVEAGIGFDQALLQVIGHSEGPLIDELTITYREMTMGRSRRDAFTLFAARCEIDEIKTFVGAIIQAEQMGISLKNVLRTQAAAMRTSRRNKIEEKAQKVQVKMLLPMIGLIFPVLLIILLGPSIVQIMREFI